MTYIRHSWSELTILALSLLGIAVSIYLTAVHYQGAPLVCSTTGFIDCESVLTSKYGLIPGTALPLGIAGLFWNLVSAAIAFVLLRGLWFDERTVRLGQLAWLVVGMASVLYLVYIELVLLHKICAWCTVVHVSILVMLLIAVFRLQQPAQPEELDVEEEQPMVTAKRD